MSTTLESDLSVKLLFASPVDPSALEHLRGIHDVACLWEESGSLKDAVAGRQVIVFRSGVEMSRNVLEVADSLELLIRAGSGLDNVDIPYVRENGLRLVRVPGPGAQAVAELAIGLMLSVSRNIALADRSLRAAHWPKHELAGGLLAEKTLGVVGVGSIGSRVAKLGVALGMTVIGCVDPMHEDAEVRLAALGVTPSTLEDTAATADFLTIHTPLTDGTLGLFDGALIATMKPGSILINTSRGGIVDEIALRHELISGARVIGAGLDVHASEGEGVMSPLADLPNVVLTPHIGAMARDSQHEIGRRIISTIAAHENGAIEDMLTPEERVV